MIEASAAPLAQMPALWIAPASLREDIRLFAVTWATGFVFFMAFLA
jgi:hypothetical protein